MTSPTRTGRSLVLALLLIIPAGCDLAPLIESPDLLDPKTAAALRRWNLIAIDASGLDHTPVRQGEARVFGEQLGPGRAARAMAIVHIAMFEAVNAVDRGCESYAGVEPAAPGTSLRIAVAWAARDALRALYPSQADAFDARLAEDLAQIADIRARDLGIELGRRCARAVLQLREGDGSDVSEIYTISDRPGAWRPDPINPAQQPLGEEWHNVGPFVLRSCAQFRAPPPPALDSPEYAAAFAEVKRIGGDGLTTPTERTPDQTHVGLFWAYDGTPSLCAPPRLYNQVVMQIAEQQDLDAVELARLLALANVAMADAGIACWDSKYYYNLWRPVCGIREADEGFGPTGLGDGNPATLCDPAFTPLGAPASNLGGPNFTPPFPAYPSGHAAFGAALFQTLRRYFETDALPFTLVSDEFNGATRDAQGNLRPLLPRSYAAFSQAEEENGQSRIYLGIHWSFDKTEGIAQGRRVADFVFDNAFRPAR